MVGVEGGRGGCRGDGRRGEEGVQTGVGVGRSGEVGQRRAVVGTGNGHRVVGVGVGRGGAVVVGVQGVHAFRRDGVGRGRSKRRGTSPEVG